MKVEVRPAFDEAVMSAELPVRKAVVKLLVKLQSLDLPHLWADTGLHFEKLVGMIESPSGLQMYSMRVTGSARAVSCLITGPTIVLVSLHVQHDKAYRK